MNSKINSNPKGIEYSEEPIGNVKVIPDILPSPSELAEKPKRNIFAEIIEGFDYLEKEREGTVSLSIRKVARGSDNH